MKIAIGADHAGLTLKNLLRDQLVGAGHLVRDFGTDSPASTDYPDYAGPVALAVAAGEFERGICLLYTSRGGSRWSGRTWCIRRTCIG